MNVKIGPILKTESITIQENLPRYLFEVEEIDINWLTYLYYRTLLTLFKLMVKIRLGIINPHYKKYSSDILLTNEEIERIYSREARNYEKKHHLTTNFRDTWWRRQTGLDVISYILLNSKKKKQIQLLDIATGTGLSLEEMFQIFKLFDVKVRAIGIDYNAEMLRKARSITLPRMISKALLEEGAREVEFSRADARYLVENAKNKKGELKVFSADSFDCITITFGIGGINDPIKSFQEQLVVLKPGGILSINDIHQQIASLDEKWPFFIGSKTANIFSSLSWKVITKPLILKTLWGWRDPTLSFYLPQFITIEERTIHKYYGFRQLSFFLDSEFWWFKLPVIPTARVVLEKVEISRKEFKRRIKILDELINVRV